jgi:hypothetical protein
MRTMATQRGWQGDDNHHHTAPPTMAASNCSRGGNREQWEGTASHKNDEDCEDDRVDRDDTNKQSRTNNKQWGKRMRTLGTMGNKLQRERRQWGAVGRIAHKMGPNDVYRCLGPRQVFMFISYFFLSTNLSRYCRFYSCSSNTTTHCCTRQTTHYPLPPSPIHSREQLLMG